MRYSPAGTTAPPAVANYTDDTPDLSNANDPVLSMAAWRDGSASTADTAPAER